MAPRSPAAGSFRRAMTIMAATVFAATVGMAVIMALAVARADTLLERLRRSQDQVAQVTRLQADVNALRIAVATGAPDAAARVEAVGRDLAAYRRSMQAESEDVEGMAIEGHQKEAVFAQGMTERFEVLRGRILAGRAEATGEAQAAFQALAERAVRQEQAEALAASLAMADLRQAITWLAAVILAVLALSAGAAVWVLLTGVVRPLQALEAAAVQSEDAEARGFSEFRSLAAAFNRMRAQIAGQQATLEAANLDLEQQVAARTAALAGIDANRRLFFSKIGHELRTPATVIRGEAEVALRETAATPERLREALQHVVENSRLLTRRLEDMLALARAEDGQVVLRREPVALAEAVRQAAALAEPYVRASGLTLSVEAPADAGVIAEGDASWLQQAILAVVDNAAKFADDREPIRLSLARAGDRARIVVADSGPGVEADDLPRLFEAWSQTAAGRAKGGSGLGLSVARWVVEQHGGEIRAQSSPGKGLTIDIELPVSP